MTTKPKGITLPDLRIPKTPFNYGAIGDGVTDDTAAFVAGLAANAGGEFYVPVGTYKISATLTVPSSTYFHGAGLGSSIVQYTSNIPILTAPGTGTKTSIEHLQLSYFSAQGLANTLAIAIQLQNFAESNIDNVFINNAYAGIYCGPNSGVSPSFVYSSTFSNIRVEGYTGYGLYLSVNGGVGNSGNVLENVYVVNGSATSPCVCGVYLSNWSDGVINQLNIEQSQHSSAPLVITACDNLTINSLHFESLTYTIDFSGLITLSGSRAYIRGLSLASITYTTANVASIVALGGTSYVVGGHCVIENLMDRPGSTITSANKNVFYSSSTSSTARLMGYVLNQFSAGLSGGTGRLLQIDNFISIDYPGLSFLTYSPTIATDASTAASFFIVATNTTAFTISAPTAGSAGQRIRYRIKNTSGGALGAVTWNGVFKLATWVSPATGFNRSIDFEFDGTNWIECQRCAADIPN